GERYCCSYVWMCSSRRVHLDSLLFSFNASPTTQIYTLSLHDALPISLGLSTWRSPAECRTPSGTTVRTGSASPARRMHALSAARSEEHTSELQSPYDLVCRLLLEKKKKRTKPKPRPAINTQCNPWRPN